MNRSVHLQVALESGECREMQVASEDRTLADELAAQGLALNTRCGRRGLCRGCEVNLEEGTLKLGEQTASAPSVVKACCAHVSGDARIHIPARSRIEHRPQVGDTFEVAVPFGDDPLFPATADGRDTAFAVDVGTTTVVVLLVDVNTGETLARAGGFNEQIRFGDNVLTRIEAARQAENLMAMQRAMVMETLQPLLLRACERAGRAPERIAGGAIAGNTTMLHLLTGEDPTPLGIAPFTPRFIAARRLTARDIDLTVDGLAADTPLQLLPGIAAYIGADITAGILASGMVFDARPSLLVDIGTNGEIVLQSGGELTACATAAGPAFEGCGLRCGTRAREGAVSGLRLGLSPFCLEADVIGGIEATAANGICGSAYIDFLANGRRSGLLASNGRFVAAVWDAIPAGHRLSEDGERALLLSDGGGTAKLCVSEVDVALLMQAKAAIGAGIEILLKTAGISASDLGCVYLAGGFGMHLHVGNAIAMGLLPGIREDQVRVMGNTSLAGAMLSLLDRGLLGEMEELRQRTKVIELNLAEDFEDHYIDHLSLP
ncbi:MAG TPA: ASKHA domain-containing protein [Luteolibacter sp.]|nr:ASKHA domain-containing protein [Luteolibacter sp.]